MRFLRQSTASQEILLGPFVAASDGSAQTGLTIANTDIKLLPGGATSESNKNSGGGTHIAGGRYSAVLDATDTATVGILEVSCNPASGIPWNKSYYVLEEAVYDALFAASAPGYVANAPVNVAQFGGTNGTFASGRPEVNASHWAGTAVGSATVRADLINIAGAAVSTTTAQLGVNAVQISGDGTAADNLETAFDDTAGAVRWSGIIDQGTAQAATGTTLQLRSAAAFADDEIIGATILITGGSAGVGQARVITDYVSSTDTATVDTWTTTPTGTITYKIYATAPGNAPTAAQIADQVWDELLSGHAVSGSAGEALSAAGTAGDPWTTALPGAYGSGTAGKIIGDNLNATVSSRATQTSLDTVDGIVDAILVDTAEIGTAGAGLTALATQASVDTIDNLLDTEIAALTTELAKVPKSDSNVTWNATALASLQQEATDALNAYDPPTKAELDSAVANVSVDEIQATAIADLFNTDSGTTYGSAVTGSAVKEIADNAGGSALTEAGIADAVWDELIAGHAVSGSTGEALSAAGGAGDPWITALPGSYSSGQAGKIVGDFLNASVSSRATQTSVDDLPTNSELSTALASADDAVLAAIAALNNLSSAQAQTAAAAALTAYDPPTRAEATSDANSILTAVGDVPTNAELATALAAADDAVLAAIAALNNLSQANVRTAVGLGSANLDTQLDALPTAAENAAALLAATVESTVTVLQSLRLHNAALGGKASGLETATAVYRDLADSKARITATVDADGNRTAVTRDLT